MIEFLVSIFFLIPTFFAFFLMFTCVMEERNSELFKDVSEKDKY